MVGAKAAPTQFRGRGLGHIKDLYARVIMGSGACGPCGVCGKAPRFCSAQFARRMAQGSEAK
jgi:hypothetical protein